MSSRLDSPLARVVAALIAVAALLSLAYLHRGDLFPGPKPLAATDDLYAECMAKREADIDGMVRGGKIAEAQAVVFERRAAGLCQAIADGKTKAR